MKLFNLKIVILLLFITSGFSQDLISSQTLSSNTGTALETANTSSLLYAFDRSDKTIQGSMYINESFTPARVTADIEKIFNLRYNAVTDEMEIESEKNTIQTINKIIPGITVAFLKDDKTYKGMTYFNEEGISVTGFLIPITNSNANVKLFMKETKAFIARKPAKSSYQETKPAKFERVDDSYYVVIGNEIAKPLSNNKKEIAALFPNHEKQILNYISSEKLNIKKKEDLVKLVAHINQLK